MNFKSFFLVVVACLFLDPKLALCQVSDVRASIEQELERFSRSLKVEGNRLELLARMRSNDVRKIRLKDKYVVRFDKAAGGKVNLFVERFVGDDPISKSQSERIIDGKRQVYALQIPERKHLMVVSDNEADWGGEFWLGDQELFVGNLCYDKNYKSFEDILAEAQKNKDIKITNKMMGELSAEYELKDKNKMVFNFVKADGKVRLISFQYWRTYPAEMTAKTGRLKAHKKVSGFGFTRMKNRLSSFTMTEKVWYGGGKIMDFNCKYELLSEKNVEDPVSSSFTHVKIPNGTPVFVKDELGLRFEFHDGKIVQVVD